jgi:hypothetical protein
LERHLARRRRDVEVRWVCMQRHARALIVSIGFPLF